MYFVQGKLVMHKLMLQVVMDMLSKYFIIAQVIALAIAQAFALVTTLVIALAIVGIIHMDFIDISFMVMCMAFTIKQMMLEVIDKVMRTIN